MKKIPFWIQITAILLIGVLSSISIATYFLDKKAERYTVTFAYGDGTIIEEKQVKSGEGVLPPVFETNNVFRGWSAAINKVENDIEVHPAMYTIEEDNLFYFDSVYVKEGKKFTLDLYVAGNVNVSSGELKLEYDPDVAEYKKFEGSNISSVEETESGKLTIRFNSNTVLTNKTLLVQVTFKAKKMDVLSTEITLTGKEIKTVENGGERSADYATINNNIYYLQEVSK